MSTADAERNAAARLPDGDVVALLLEQHARIHDLFAELAHATGESRQKAFDALRALLAVHEAAEEMVVRPVAKETAGAGEARARDAEEAEATRVLRRLEGMDVSTPEFDEVLTGFERTIGDHAEYEEREEFPALVAHVTVEQRQAMGARLRRIEHLAPVRAHPWAGGSRTALVPTGPFTSMVDRARDALAHG